MIVPLPNNHDNDNNDHEDYTFWFMWLLLFCNAKTHIPVGQFFSQNAQRNGINDTPRTHFV